MCRRNLYLVSFRRGRTVVKSTKVLKGGDRELGPYIPGHVRSRRVEGRSREERRVR